MKQCKECRRFLSREAKTCPYCGSGETVSNVVSPARDDELRNYQVFADGISIGNRDYRIIDAIGQGSHGVVLKVEDNHGKYYALKVPFRFNELFSNSQGNRQSVLDTSHKYISHEIKILGRIDSDALIGIIYAGPVRCGRGETFVELPGILMELAEGTLKDIIDGQVDNRVALPYEEKENIVKQLTIDIEKLHAEGLVHRDLSPHNIFVVEREKEIRYVLADFGASKAAAGHENRDSTTKLAFHDRYLDPALLLYDHLRYDSRIDIYQLGIIITEVLLGEYWQAEDNTFSTSDFRWVDFENDFLLIFARFEIHPALLKRIRRATTLNIHRRYPSALEFRKEIHKALETIRKKEKKSPGTHRGEESRRTISVSFKHLFQSDEPTVTDDKEVPIIPYNRQRQIPMGAAEALNLDFGDLQLTGARVMGPSFLECRRPKDTENTLMLRVKTDAIRKSVQPLINRHKTADRRFRMELEFKSLLRVSSRDFGVKNNKEQ